MTREEAGKIITSLVKEVEEFSTRYEKSSEIVELLSRYDSASEEEKKILEKEANDFVNNQINAIAYKVSPEDSRELLSYISLSFANDNNIQVNGWGLSSFESIIISFLEREKENPEFLNTLLKNETFTEVFHYSSPLLEKLLSYADDQDVIHNYLKAFTNNCSSNDEKKNMSEPNRYLAKNIGIILKSDKFDNEFKESLLNDPELFPFFGMNYLVKEIAASSLPKETKLKYLTNPLYRGNTDNSFWLTSAITELCTTKEDYLSVINNPEIAEHIDMASLLSSAKLPPEDLKEIFLNDTVQAHLESFQVSRFIKEADLDYETRKSLMFNERFSKIMNAGFFKNILASKVLTKEQRMELLTDERIYKFVHDGWEFDGIIPTIMKSKEVPIDEKIAIAKDDRFSSELDAEDMHKILADPDISIEDANELLLDKKLFYRLIDEYNEEYNPKRTENKGPFKYDKYEFLLELMRKNPYIAKTISYKVFKDEMLDLGVDFIDKLSRDYTLCKSFSMRVGKNNPTSNLFVKNAIETILNSDYKDSIDLSEFITRISESALDYRFDDRDRITEEHIERKIVQIRNKSHLKYDELSKENWKTLTEIGLRDLSPYLKNIELTMFMVFKDYPDPRLNILPDVNSKEDLDNYEERRRALCDDVFKKAIESKDLESAKNALFNKYFNINIEEAIEIIKLYGPSIDEFDNNPEHTVKVKYIKDIKGILELEKLSQVKDVYESPITPLTFDESIYMNQALKRMFCKDISDSVYKVNGEPTEIEVNGRKVKVYEPGFDFKMLVHSTDAYGKLELINDNYDDSWNKSTRTTNHGICCSLIANSNMGIAAVNDVLFGFDGWDEKSISKMAPYDIYSMNDSYDLQEGRKMIFMSANEIINNTRHAHNEMVLERRELRPDKINQEKPNIQPSYVIIYSDMADEIKEKAIKCSEQMNIPIVYLDKEKIANHEVSRIDSKIEEIKECHDLDGKIDLLKELLIIHENNRSGYRITNADWLEEKFPTSKIDKVVKQLVASIQIVYGETKDIASYHRQSEKLMRVLDEENQKFIVTQENQKRKHDIDLPLDDYKKELMQYVNPSIGKTNVPLLEYIIDKHEDKEDGFSRKLSSIDKGLIHEQVELLQKDGLYEYAGRSHNIGHIERVLTFATLLGREELKNDDGIVDEHTMELLTKAAIYHDCARENDAEDRNHGKRSAEAAVDLLRNQGYSEDDIKIIKVAIEYHEVDDDELRFKKLCDKNGLTEEQVECAKKVATCLKDADALDRTRFKNGAALDVKKLRTGEAKKLVDFADELNATYRKAPAEVFKDSCKKKVASTMEIEAAETTMGGMENDGRQR